MGILKTIYNISPIFIQNIAVSLSGYIKTGVVMGKHITNIENSSKNLIVGAYKIS